MGRRAGNKQRLLVSVRLPAEAESEHVKVDDIEDGYFNAIDDGFSNFASESVVVSFVFHDCLSFVMFYCVLLIYTHQKFEFVNVEACRARKNCF